MKVIIIGAKGMLGSMLATIFEDHKPLLWDKDDIDITNIEQVREKFQQEQPTVVINAAAYTDVDGAETNRDVAFLVNETGVRNLATVAQELDAKLVHYSTDYVFPGTSQEGYKENDPPGPAVNVYGESKLAGERALVEVKPFFYLIRTAWLYGPNGKNFVETMLSLAATKKELQVVHDQHGCPTFTKDVAQFTRHLIDESYSSGIYHAVNGGMTTWFDFAKEIFMISGLHIDVQPTTSNAFIRPAKRPAYSILLNTQGPAMRSWQEALKEYISTRQ